jgi:hypothetical protein
MSGLFLAFTPGSLGAFFTEGGSRFPGQMRDRLFRRAAAAAFLMFLRAAFRCFSVIQFEIRSYCQTRSLFCS